MVIASGREKSSKPFRNREKFMWIKANTILLRKLHCIVRNFDKIIYIDVEAKYIYSQVLSHQVKIDVVNNITYLR